jgi:hypothetical protein
MAVLAGKLEARRKDCAQVAGKSTLPQLEHAPAEGEAFAPARYHKIGHNAGAIEELFVTLFGPSLGKSLRAMRRRPSHPGRHHIGPG